jgi:hypothetical protein
VEELGEGIKVTVVDDRSLGMKKYDSVVGGTGDEDLLAYTDGSMREGVLSAAIVFFRGGENPTQHKKAGEWMELLSIQGIATDEECVALALALKCSLDFISFRELLIFLDCQEALRFTVCSLKRGPLAHMSPRFCRTVRLITIPI